MGGLGRVLLAAARRIDALSAAIGRGAGWLVLAACLVSAANALLRYGAHFAAPALLDLPALLFAGIVLGAAPRTLAEGRHIRVDVLFRRLRPRWRALVDILGNLVFLIPLCVLMAVEGAPFFLASWRLGERSAMPGGLPQWPMKGLIAAAFALLLLQALSELAKSVAAFAASGAERPPGPSPIAARRPA